MVETPSSQMQIKRLAKVFYRIEQNIAEKMYGGIL